MRIIIVADNASSLFGGEAFLPFNYFRFLRGEIPSTACENARKPAMPRAQNFDWKRKID